MAAVAPGRSSHELQELLLDCRELQSFTCKSQRPHVRHWLQNLLGEIESRLAAVIGEESARFMTAVEQQAVASSSPIPSLSSALQAPVALSTGHESDGLDELLLVQATERAERRAAVSAATGGQLPSVHGSLSFLQNAYGDAYYPGAGPPQYPGPTASTQLVPIRLDTCSFEQTPESIKIYVPLRGVQTEMLRTHFGVRSVEVRVYNLHGRNYVFSLQPTTQAIVPRACFAVASKTRKNILITLQKLSAFSNEERQWPGLKAANSWPGGPHLLPPPQQ